MLSFADVNTVLRYEPDTGKLFWREGSKFAGREAGTRSHGYIYVQFPGRKHSAHQLGWLLHFGVWAGCEIDHIDGDCANNRIGNLRLVSHQENCRNQKKPKSNTSGIMGVTWHKQRQKWYARIKVDYRYIHLGLFADIEDARRARRDAEIAYGFHSNHGR